MKNLQNKRKPKKRSLKNRPPERMMTFPFSRNQKKAERLFFVSPRKSLTIKPFTIDDIQSHMPKIVNSQIVNQYAATSIAQFPVFLPTALVN
jgi:hypothetical protein